MTSTHDEGSGWNRPRSARVISTREAAAWLVAFLVVATLLVRTGFTSDDPDSALYAAMAERVAELPLRDWIAPSWWGLWNGAGLFTDHPAGLLIPPAALGAAGIPAIQASYVWGIAYALLSLLLLGRMVGAIGGPREGRSALVLLQLMPVAFVFRIRANHEYPMLLCLLVALVGLDGVRRSWWWLPVVPLALTLALLIKGVFVVLVLLAAGLWVVTNPTHQPGAASRPIVALALSVAVMAVAALLYELAYRQITGQPFWHPYWQRPLGHLSPDGAPAARSALVSRLGFYVSLMVWHPAPWSLALVAALWRGRRRVRAIWDRLEARERRGLTFVLAFAATAILAVSLSSRVAERYAFPVTYTVATAGVIAALRGWPSLARAMDRLDAAVPALPVVVWCALILLRLLAGPALPSI